MSISIATQGKFWMLPDGGGLVCYGGGEGSYTQLLEKKKPVVNIHSVIQEKKIEIHIEVIGVYYD